MARPELSELIHATRSPISRDRQRAVRELCACRLKANYREAWDRVFELTADPDADVRRSALHVLIDGSPRTRREEVVRALEAMRDEPQPKVRRHVRKILARYRRTGQVNLGLH